MNEFELIARLTPLLPTNDYVVAGPGDDCAVLDLGVPDRDALLKTDAVVEGIHFTRETPPSQIGHKALARCLSDIAAMGGSATAAVITLALPPDHDAGRIIEIYRGMAALAARHQVAIVGGETTTNPDRMLLSVAVLGLVAKGRAIRRKGAKLGDALFVTGELGGSIQGRHLDFEPRLPEGRWLAESFSIHAMIDLSDGLAGDLRHILAASGNLGAELLRRAVPISRAARQAGRESTTAKPAFVAALTDGEDFELLFTVAAADAIPLSDAWRARFPSVKLSCIGRITAGPGITIRDATGVKPLLATGYTHFR
jgi:thiamine-monophosphate kinase